MHHDGAGMGDVARIPRLDGAQHEQRSGAPSALTVGRADDRAEREADAVADRVLRSIGSSRFGVVRNSDSAGKVRRAVGPNSVSADAGGIAGPHGGAITKDIEQRIRRSDGVPLDPVVKSDMEVAFGSDFGNVRVHRSSPIAPELGARAFTHGSDIHFAPGEFRPSTREGAHLIAHELAHVEQQVGEQAEGDRIRRKMGFEFEDASWRPWRRTIALIDYLPRMAVRPVERQKAVHRGAGFEAQGDDSLGPRHPSLEFVTEPFDTTPAGLLALRTALFEIRDIYARLAAVAGVHTGPPGNEDPPYRYNAADYVQRGVHQLNGGGVMAMNVLLSHGVAAGRLKMQSTMGVSLSDLPTMMETFGNVPAGGETPAEAGQRANARALQQSVGFANLLGRSPALARAVLVLIQGDPVVAGQPGHEIHQAAHTAPLIGYLALVMNYLKGMQMPDAVEGAKSRIMFMARNSFADLYDLLHPNIQTLLAANNGLLLRTHALAVSNANPVFPQIMGQLPDTGLTLGDPFVNPVILPARIGPDGVPRPAQYNPRQQAMANFTIGTWLTSVSQGQDHLSARGMKAWLRSEGMGRRQAGDTAEWVAESFGGYGVDNSTGAPLALFENRAILDNNVTFARAARVAYNQLDWLVTSLAAGHWNTPYPDNPIPGY